MANAFPGKTSATVAAAVVAAAVAAATGIIKTK